MAENIANVRIRVNDSEAVDKIKNLEKESEALRRKFAEACAKGDTKGIKEVGKELDKVDKELRTLRTNSQNIEAALARLDRATPKELRNTIKAINRELNSGRVQRGSEEWNAYIRKLHEVQTELRECTSLAGAAGGGGFLGKLSSFCNKWWGAFGMMATSVAGVSLSLDELNGKLEAKEGARADLKALTGLGDDDIAWLTAQAEKLSTTMEESGLRITQSSDEIIKAFMLVGSNKPELLSDKEALSAVTTEAMRLAKAAGMDLEPAVKAMTTALNQYGLGAEEASRVVNILAAGSKAGAANVQEQAAAILNAGTAAASAGIPVEQLVGAIETLGEKGVKAEVAGTGLKSVFLALSTGAADTNPKVVGLNTALENLKAKIDAAEAAGAGGGAALLKKMFGSGGYNIASILTENIEALGNYTEAVTGTQTALEQAAIVSATASAKLAQAKNRITEAGMSVAAELAPALTEFTVVASEGIKLILELIKWIAQFRFTILSLTAAMVAYIAIKEKDVMMSRLQIFWNDKVKVSFQNLTKTLLKNPYGILISLVAALIGRMVELGLKEKESMENAKELNARLQDQKSEIEELIRAAQNMNLKYEEQAAAVNKLNNMIPGFNGKINETTREFSYSAQAVDNYIDSLMKLYEVEGAMDQLKALGEKKAKLNVELAANQKVLDELYRERAATTSSFGSNPGANISTTGAGFGWGTASAQGLTNEIWVIESKVKYANWQLDEIADQEKKIRDAYGTDIARQYILKDPDIPPGDYDPSVDKTGKTEDTAAVTKEQEEKATAIVAEGEAERLRLRSDAFVKWTQGATTYREFLRETRDAELDSLEGRQQALEDAGLAETEVYKEIVSRQKDIIGGAMEEDREALLKEIELTHDEAVRSAQNDFNDPTSILFNDQRALKMSLLQADMEYLLAKLDLYEKGTQERMDIEKQIEDRENRDREEKQQELAKRVNEFRKRYTSIGIEEEKKIAIAGLEEMHKAGLITEEQYQKALEDIRRDARDKEIDQVRKVSSEYADMVINIWTAFSDLFKHIKEGGGDLAADLATATQAALAVMTAGLQQFTAYQNAARDLEVAKLEQKYDAEIKAAEGNSAKVAEIEEKKEAEVAKVKSEYNDRAMKIEIAQAIATTAQAAIAAYASASAVPVTGWIMGPIAAALATAAGMAQVATIKKQHEAQAMGYYSGGFTAKDRDNRKEVGVVHANEFVANHEAVANPELSPVLRMIDYAQRTNTVGRLTSEDVRLAAGGGTVISQVRQADMSAVNEAAGRLQASAIATREAVDRLERTLSKGVEAYVVLDGEQGLHRRYTKYQKNIQNAQR